MERSGRSEGQYCLRSHPSNIQRRGGGAARSGKEWICKAVSGVVLRTLATRGRKRVPASEAQRGGWSEAEGPKDNTACGCPTTTNQLSPTNNHQPSTDYHKPTTINQQPTTPNQPPHQPAATIDKPPPGNHEKEDDLQVDRLISRPAKRLLQLARVSLSSFGNIH